MLMSDLTDRSLACEAHLNMLIENALYKFMTITITINIQGKFQGHCLTTFFFLRNHLLRVENRDSIPFLRPIQAIKVPLKSLC